MPAQLHTENLSLTAGNQLLLDAINIRLNPGEVVALIGPNGAGKSTLLRTLTGFQLPTAGNVLLNGKDLTRWSNESLSRLRAVMRQQSALAFNWHVEEIIAMGRAPWPAQTTAQVVSQVMNLTGCDALKGRDFCHLSGGEQQRVQLARALAQLWHDDIPRGWLFLDEPTSALDLHYQQHLLRLLKRLAKMGELSVCVVLHDLNLAALWSDRIVLLHQGRVVADGTPDEVLEEQRLQHWYQADIRVLRHPDHPVPQVVLGQ